MFDNPKRLHARSVWHILHIPKEIYGLCLDGCPNSGAHPESPAKNVPTPGESIRIRPEETPAEVIDLMLADGAPQAGEDEAPEKAWMKGAGAADACLGSSWLGLLQASSLWPHPK